MEWPWKEASSLIITCGGSVTDKVNRNVPKIPVAPGVRTSCDYRIMMVKRSGMSSFMASAYVFPGGMVEVADYSPKWWHVFETLGLTRTDLEVFSTCVVGSRPPMITNPIVINNAKRGTSESVDFLPADIALRIAAIRETFEETGVLLLTQTPSISLLSEKSRSLVPVSDLDNINVDLTEWREKVAKNPDAFLDLCLQTGLCPDLWSLYEWCNWLTPISVGHRRFDAIFYICCLENEPKVVLDNSEVISLKWCTPIEMLEEHRQEKVFLAPPQVYELSRIYNLPNFKAVQEFAHKRQRLGIERWLPVISTYSDGAISVLPGDDNYPREPDIIGKKPIPDFPQSLEEMRAKAIHMNRLEMRGPICQTYCNMKLNCGHLSPFTYPPISTVVQSML
ncbi:acyl-coenzyme A diphosphatase NUDT19-like isoform X2 [Oppia nitens]|nr:acyl-coenzyme A diphosphatase NUDT19-like isoform X2 [Oppia nitens]XP_054165332.1 acyl-coenzyme A diphosphatase NUDT19-like isoform X2 [Oppia nitens]XP_054165333.1 acyl-coenzyme A diphosphatase NUDT19-like isoform X2 [Oppia nitens]